MKSASQLYAILKKDYPNAKCALNFKNPLELLVATILSAQCTDKRVNMVTPAVFKKHKTAKSYANAKPSEFQKLIHSTGFYKNKTKSILGAANLLHKKYKGSVPNTLEELVKLPGVGRKTANVILGNVFGIPGITVDTHMGRLARRMGFTKEKDPVKIELSLMKLIEKKNWTHFSHVMIHHGRAICDSRKPLCSQCSIQKDCPKTGVTRHG